MKTDFLFQTLPSKELQEIEQKDRLFVSGYADFTSQHLILFRADKKCYVVPFNSFRKSGNGIEPNFEQLSIIDYGQTIKLGEYEACSEAIMDKIDLDTVRVVRTKKLHKVIKKFEQSEQKLPQRLLDEGFVSMPCDTYLLDNGTLYYDFELEILT